MQQDRANPIAKIAEPIGRIAAMVCGYAVLFLAFAISFEIVARKLFSYSLHGIDDIGGYVLACAATVGAAYTMTLLGHTRVDIFLNIMPYRMQRALNTLAMVIFAIFAAFGAWRATTVLMESIQYQSMATNPLRTPLWQPQLFWVAGLYILALVSLAFAAHAAWLFVKKSPMLNIWYGPAGGKHEDEATAIKSIDDPEDGGAAPRSGGKGERHG